jgi:hypothetical protein
VRRRNDADGTLRGGAGTSHAPQKWSGSRPGACRLLVGEEPRRQSSPWPDASPFVMHRMWVDGTEFRWRKETDAAAAA